MANISDLQDLPEIDYLNDLNISQESIVNEFIIDYQNKYKEITGNDITLYPADPDRIRMQVVSGEIYQVYEFIAYLFKQNFIQYMNRESLENWGANIGYAESNLKAAKCTLEFSTNDTLNYDVTIPAGTRVTAGDDVYFATDEACVLKSGESSAAVLATCTVDGTIGNEYAIGQINVIADPVVNISSVKNTTISSGGQNEFDDDTLRENIFKFPSTFSTAGPGPAYEYFAKKYSGDIVSASVVQNNTSAEVDIYIMLSDGNVPDSTYCDAVSQYISGLQRTPDTDKVNILAPDIVYYNINATYYISASNAENETTIKESVEEAAEAFVEKCYTNIGNDVVPDMLTELVRVAGAKRIEIASPVYTKISETQIGICESISLLYGGLEDD